MLQKCYNSKIHMCTYTMNYIEQILFYFYLNFFAQKWKKEISSKL
jgi:hypothetical protein